MDKQEKRRRMHAMRACLRQVQQLLPKDKRHNTPEFICIQINRTDFDAQTCFDARRYVMRALKGASTFNIRIMTLNPGRSFSFAQMMTLRRQWIDMLCARLTKEINKL